MSGMVLSKCKDRPLANLIGRLSKMIEKISTASCILGLSLFIGFTGGNKADFKKDAVETKMHELTRSQATVTR